MKKLLFALTCAASTIAASPALAQEGVADFLQVLTAQQNLLSTQQQLAIATTNVSANLVALYKALGGGWETQLPAANENLTPIGAPHL